MTWLLFVFHPFPLLCCRYDLRVRYIPDNFLEKFKEDRTTLLYFYQQVSNMLDKDSPSLLLESHPLVGLHSNPVPGEQPFCWFSFQHQHLQEQGLGALYTVTKKRKTSA